MSVSNTGLKYIYLYIYTTWKIIHINICKYYMEDVGIEVQDTDINIHVYVCMYVSFKDQAQIYIFLNFLYYKM